jgi:hypothetical protein
LLLLLSPSLSVTTHNSLASLSSLVHLRQQRHITTDTRHTRIMVMLARTPFVSRVDPTASTDSTGSTDPFLYFPTSMLPSHLPEDTYIIINPTPLPSLTLGRPPPSSARSPTLHPPPPFPGVCSEAPSSARGGSRHNQTLMMWLSLVVDREGMSRPSRRRSWASRWVRIPGIIGTGSDVGKSWGLGARVVAGDQV